MFDLLIKNGQVIDGSKGPPFKADVAIQADTIAEVGNLGAADTTRMIDAGGKMVAPGFIDIHSHGDFTLAACPTADSLIHQGVTTAVVGQCGLSLAPLLGATRDEVILSLDTRRMPIPWDKWSDFKSYLDFMKALGLSINIVPLAGQGTIRAGVMGFASGRATPDQMAAMQAEAVKALEVGAIGISTGLVYPPGSYASTEELIELTRPVGQRRGFYFSHIRGEGQSLTEAVAEAIRIGRETGAAVQISHLKAGWPNNWEKQARALEMIEQARLEGLDVSADVYPYLAGSTSLKSGLPQWAQEGGKGVILERLTEPGTRHKIVEDMKKEGLFQDGAWDKILISHSTRRPDYAGRYVADMAAEAGKPPEEWVLDALVETELDPNMILFMISEANLKTALQNPAVMIGSDSSTIPTHGPLAEGVPHPRTFGTFPRVLARYVREEGVLSLEEAVHKMTGLSANKLRLSDRGLIKAGLKADLVVFDPKTIRDRATYEDPFHYPEGIFQVICNGIPVIADGQPTGARPGRVLVGG
jgi:N-acyl-D-amino-acid deacylase